MKGCGTNIDKLPVRFRLAEFLNSRTLTAPTDLCSAQEATLREYKTIHNQSVTVTCPYNASSLDSIGFNSTLLPLQHPTEVRKSHILRELALHNAHC